MNLCNYVLCVCLVGAGGFGVFVVWLVPSVSGLCSVVVICFGPSGPDF